MPARAPVKEPDGSQSFGRDATGDNTGRQVRFMEWLEAGLPVERRNRSVHAQVRVGSAAMLAPFAIRSLLSCYQPLSILHATIMAFLPHVVRHLRSQ